jgi:hypothetical protein
MEAFQFFQMLIHTMQSVFQMGRTEYPVSGKWRAIMQKILAWQILK